MSASTTSKSSNTTRTTFQIAAKSVAVQTKTELEPTLSRQQKVAMVEVTADILSSADQTKIKLVNCAVQVVVKTANKSVNAQQEYANFRLDKETQVTEHNYLSQEEEAKFEMGGKELGWFTPYQDAMLHDPNRQVTHYIKQIILAKLSYKNYARPSAPAGRKGTSRDCLRAREQMYNSYWLDVQLYYGETYDGNLTRTEEDEVIEVTTEEQLKTRYSSFDQFLGVSNARRNLF